MLNIILRPFIIECLCIGILIFSSTFLILRSFVRRYPIKINGGGNVIKK